MLAKLQQFEPKLFFEDLSALHRTIVEDESLLKRLVKDNEKLKQQKKIEQMNGEINKHLNHLLSKTSKLEAERAAASVPAPVPVHVPVQPSPSQGSAMSGSARRPTMGAARMVAQAQKAAAELSVNELFEITNELDEIASTLSISSSSSSAPSVVEYDPFEIESDLQAEPDANVVATQRTKCFQQTIRKLISDPKGRAWWSTELGGRVWTSLLS